MAAINHLMRPIYLMGYSTLDSQKASNQWGVAGMDQGSQNRPQPKGNNIQCIFLVYLGVVKGTYAR